MKYSIFALAATTGTAFAAAIPGELVERAACSASTINSGISSINSALTTLDNDFKNIKTSDGSDINLFAFLSDSSNLQNVLSNQVSAVRSCSPGISGTDVDLVQSSMLKLISSVSKVASDAIAKKGAISSRGLGGQMNGQASSLSSSANAYATALRSKIPASKSATANSDISMLNNAIKSIFVAYPN